MTDLRTANSRTFVGPHGAFEAHIYPVAVNYKDANGSWQPIDNTLVPGADGGAAGYINGANRLHVELPHLLGTAPARVSDGKNWVSFSLDNATGIGTTSGPTETFSDALPGVDLSYSMTNTELKENLVLAGPASPRTFSYTVSTSPGLTATLAADGSIQFLDANNNLQFSFLAPAMTDAAGGDAHASYTLTPTAGGYTVTLNADTPWLASPDRVWPVTIDPTVPDDSGYYPTTGQLSPTTDGYLVSGSTAGNQNWFGLGYEKVGWNLDSSSVAQYRHGLLQFNAEGALPAGAQVLDAELNLYLTSRWATTSADVGVYQVVDDPWTSGATWNTYDGTHSWTTAGGDVTTDPQGHAWTSTTIGGSTPLNTYWSWNITQLVAGWAGSTVPDHGLLLKSQNETTNPNLFTFNSSHATSNLPYVSVKYEYGVGSRSTYTFSGFPLASPMDGSVNVGNGNLLLCQTDLSLPGIDGFGLTLKRCLNSLTMGDITNQNAQLDTNWTMTPGQATYIDSVNGTLVYHNDQGDLVPFTPDASGNYVNATDFNGSLSVTTGNLAACGGRVYGYQLTMDADGSSQYFSGTTGRLQAEADANGNTICFSYGSNIYGTGTILTSITDTEGRTISFNYTNSNLTLSSITWPGASCPNGTCTDSYGYTNGNLTSFTDPAGAQTTYDYNSSNQLTSIHDADGHTTSFVYTTINGYGPAVSSITDGATNGILFAYGVAGSLCSAPATETDITHGTLPPTRYCHDNGLRVSTTEAPGGAITQSAYTTTNQSANCVDQYGDSLDNQVCSSTDSKQNTTTYSYLSSYPQDVASVSEPLASGGTATTSYTYDSADSHPYLPKTETDPPNASNHSTVISYSYDSNGNPTSTAIDGTTTSQSVYSGQTYNGQAQTCGGSSSNRNLLCLSEDANGNWSAYTYDTNGNLTSQTTGLNSSIACPSGDSCPKTTYSYDNLGHRLTEVAPLGNVSGGTPANYTTSYSYDADGRLLSVTDPLGHATSYTYDAVGNETSVTDANGLRTVKSYDGDNRLASTQTGLQYNASTQTYACASGSTCPTTSYSYDVDGNKVTETDPMGHVTNYGYSVDDRLTSVTTPLGNETTYSYDANGNQTGVVDPRGNVSGGNPASYTTTKAYNPQGQLTSVTDPLGDTTSYGYDAAGNQTSVTDANNHVTSYVYDDQGRVQTVTAPDGGVTTYSYDGNGNVLARSDANGHVTTYTYDNNGNLSTVTGPDPDGSGPLTAPVTTYQYDANGNKTKTIEPGGQSISYTYDRANRLTNISYSDSTPAVSYSYDNAGNRTSMSDGAGTVTYTYDNNNQLRSSTRGTDMFVYAYNAAGDVTSRSYPGGTSASYSYDNDNQLVSVSSGGNTTSYAYDAAGHLTQTTLPSFPSFPSAAAYGGEGGHAGLGGCGGGTGGTYGSVSSGSGISASYHGGSGGAGYVACGIGSGTGGGGGSSAGSGTNGSNGLHGVPYTGSGAALGGSAPSGGGAGGGITSADGGAPGGRPGAGGGGGGATSTSTSCNVSYTAGAGADGKAVITPNQGNQTSYPSAGTYTYTVPSGATSLTVGLWGGGGGGGRGWATQNASAASGGGGGGGAYALTTNLAVGAGETLRVIVGHGGPAGAHGGGSSLCAPFGSASNGSAGGDSSVASSSVSYIETRSYDTAGRLTAVNNTDSNGVALSDFTYTLDNVGNPTKVVQSGAVSSTTTYTYDANNRLIDACYQLSCNEGTGSTDSYIHWTYDKVGNRLTEARPSGTTSYSYNNDDELLSAGSTNYTYDANGNELAAGTQTFTFNAANQLTSSTSGGTPTTVGTTTNYTYDGDGDRLSATTGGTATNYLWDTNHSLPQLALERDGSGNILRSYLYGLRRISMTSSGSPYYYLYDGLGSVVNLVSASGTTEWTYAYDPFGAMRTPPGSQTQNDPNAPTNPMQFAGEMLDATSGLYDLRARQYGASDGRFLSLDPVAPPAGQPVLSAYAYADDAPTTHWDPSGQVTLGVCGGISFGWFGWGLSFSGCLTRILWGNNAGQMGAVGTIGGGKMFGASVSVSLSYEVSNAVAFNQLGGFFFFSNLTIAPEGFGPTATVFWNGHGIFGVMLGVSILPGASELYGGSNTWYRTLGGFTGALASEVWGSLMPPQVRDLATADGGIYSILGWAEKEIREVKKRHGY